MSKESLGILLAIGAFVVSLALYLVDKSGKQLPPYATGGLLVLLVGMAIWGTLLIPWFWSSQSTFETVWRVAFGAAIVTLLIGRFGIWVWPASVSATVNKAGDVKPLLGDVQDVAYRDLVAEVIHEISPASRVSVGTLVTTPDGTRRVDVEVTSLDEKKPFVTDIDVLDLPSGHPAGVEVVDAADSKRPDIKADAILVCSNTGFDGVAISKAKRKQIGLISVLHQGDKRVKAVIEEETYLRKATIVPFTLTYIGATKQDDQILNEFLKGGNDAEAVNAVSYNGGSVGAWLQTRTGLVIGANPFLQGRIKGTFTLKEPAGFDVRGHRVKLRAFSIEFSPRVQWLSQIVQLDATSGIYDYVRGRVRLAASGTRSYTVRGIDFDRATPLSSPPDPNSLGVGLAPLAPGEVDMALVNVRVEIPAGTIIPQLEPLVRPEDLDLRVPSPTK